jgi:hypothetical protein
MASRGPPESALQFRYSKYSCDAGFGFVGTTILGKGKAFIFEPISVLKGVESLPNNPKATGFSFQALSKGLSLLE